MQAQQQQQQQQQLRAFAVPVGQPPQNLIDAVIVRDGYFERCSSGGNNFGFKYHSGGSVAVEGNITVALHRNDKAPYYQYPWLLNLKSFLWLQPTAVDAPNDFQSAFGIRTYIKNNSVSEFNRVAYREYGMHLFVATDNILHALKLFKNGPNEPFGVTEICAISDIVPKARIFKRSGVDVYDYCVIKSVIIVANRDIRISHDIFARWWYRFGREQVTRFVECGNFDHNWDRYIDIKKTRNYFGLYVHDRAKLILIDVLDDPNNRNIEHNRTLVLGGVFVIINGFLNYVFFHNMRQVNPINSARFIRLYNQFNVTAARIAGNINNPVIMLCPLPSRGESLCWSASIGILNNILMAKLEVPAFGLCRLAIYEWAEGLTQVRREQAVHHYHQNVRIAGVSQPIPHTDIRVTHLHANDQLDLTRVISDDPTLFQHN